MPGGAQNTRPPRGPALRRFRSPRALRLLVRLARAVLFAFFRFQPRDDDRLVAYLYWLQRYLAETGRSTESEPLAMLSGFDSWLRQMRSLRLADLLFGPRAGAPHRRTLGGSAVMWPLYPAYWLSRLARSALHRIAAIAARCRLAIQNGLPAPLHPPARAIVGSITRFGRTASGALADLLLRIRRRVVAALRVERLHPDARRCAYELLIRHGDLMGAAQAFEMLAHMRYAPAPRGRALDQFLFRLLPRLQPMADGIAQTEPAAGEGKTLLLALALLDRSDVDRFLAHACPTLLAEGNLPALAGHSTVLLHVHATPETQSQLARDPAFARLKAFCDIRFEAIPEGLADPAVALSGDWVRAVLTQQSYQLAARLGADVHSIDPGAVYSRFFFRVLHQLLGRDGVGLIAAPVLAVDPATAGPALAAHQSADGSITLAAPELHALLLAHLHPGQRQALVTAAQLSGGKIPWPPTILWPARDGLIVHTTGYHPLLVAHDRVRAELPFSPVADAILPRWTRRDEPAARYLLRPSDDVGLMVVGRPDGGGITLVPADQAVGLFHSQYAGDDLTLLRRELRLPLAGVPAMPSQDLRAAFAAFIDQLRQGRPDGAADAGLAPAILSVAELVSVADSIFRFEVSSGCGPEVEAKIMELRRIVREDRTTYDATAVENDNLVQLAVYFLRLGLIDELNALRARHTLPLDATIAAFIDHTSEAQLSFARDGEEWRAARGDLADLFVLSGVVWGEEYVRNFMDFCLRSILAPGNLPGIAALGSCRILITTDQKGAAAIRRHPAYELAARHAEWQLAIVPDAMIAELSAGHLRNLFYLLYGMLDHVGIFLAQGARANLFMIPVDAIVADGSLVNMAGYRQKGFECCGGGNLVGETETFLPELASRFDGRPEIAIATAELASLAIAHPHHYFVSQVISRENADFGKDPRELFWPVDGGMEIHSCFIHPLFTAAEALQRYRRKHFANVDYGMIPRMFSDASRIRIIGDTREAYINNFASGKRRYETTGRPFAFDDFLAAHRFTYPVQKALFAHGQMLPCRYDGITPYRDVAADVAALCGRLLPPAPDTQPRPQPASRPARAAPGQRPAQARGMP
jgi:hypothetical protein